jgi:hypothetical protein
VVRQVRDVYVAHGLHPELDAVELHEVPLAAHDEDRTRVHVQNAGVARGDAVAHLERLGVPVVHGRR